MSHLLHGRVRHRRPTEHSCGEVCKDVVTLHSLAAGRRAKRYESGALSLNTPKLAFVLDGNGNPAEFASYPIRDSNKLVEVGRFEALEKAAPAVLPVSIHYRATMIHLSRPVREEPADFLRIYAILSPGVGRSYSKQGMAFSATYILTQPIAPCVRYLMSSRLPVRVQEYMLLANYLVAQQVRGDLMSPSKRAITYLCAGTSSCSDLFELAGRTAIAFPNPSLFDDMGHTYCLAGDAVCHAQHFGRKRQLFLNV